MTKKELEPEPAPVPIPPKQEDDDLTPEQMTQLTKQIEQMEKKKVPQEAEVSEDVEKLQQIQAEIERMQNSGAFRVELLYQLLGVNANLNRIATAIEKVIGEDGQ
jgi:uncharacterized protein (UPF0305 family)